jgi:hypothetical protein
MSLSAEWESEGKVHRHAIRQNLQAILSSIRVGT